MLVLPVGRRGRARDAARRLPAVPRLSARPGPVTTLGRVAPTGQAVIAWVARRELPVLGLWAALAIVLAAITTRVADWFVMTNELLYERRAIASAQTLSPLPQIRGTVIQSFDQLYPLLIAPVFRYGLVPGDLIQAHFLNAWIMSSACIPVFLLARRVTGRAWAAYAAAFLAVTIPWIVYSSFLLTEVAAYPAFLWGVFGVQRATAAPSPRRDGLALGGIALAFFARTQFAILAIVLPLAILAHEIGRARGVRPGLRTAFRAHRLLVAIYGLLLFVALCLIAVGRLHRVLGVYGDTISGNLLPAGTGKWFLIHMATISLGLGILPYVVGVAWLLANFARPSASKEFHAFACVGALAVGLITLQVTIFDQRFAGGFVHDRYLFYVVPVVTLAFLCALIDSRRPRLSLLLPTGLVAAGFAVDVFGLYRIINSDTPVSDLDDFILRVCRGSVSTAHWALAIVAVTAVILFAYGTILLRHSHLTTLLVALLLVALPAETAYGFVRLFRVDGWSGRPLTLHYGDVLDWVDKTVGTHAKVTMISYPYVPGDFWQSYPFWRDMEFWNKSIVRAAYAPNGAFQSTGSTFPKIYLSFDDETGAVHPSPSPLVAEALKESRFRIDGEVLGSEHAVNLIKATMPWRTDWLTYGLTDDGWTQPGVTARIRVFSTPAQRHAVIRYLTLQLWLPDGVASRPYRLASGVERADGVARNTSTTVARVRVCVPAHGYAEARLRTPQTSPIYGDMRDLDHFNVPRRGGLFVAEIALADELGPSCSVDGPGAVGRRA